MKSIMLTLTLFLFWSCGDGTSQPMATAPPAELTAVTAPPASTNIDHPCDAISGATISRIFGWEGANEAMPTTMREGRLQSCYYTSTNNVGAATITISQSSERTIERAGLERSFATDLANTEDRLDYEEVSAGLGDQSIYGRGKRGPSHTYRLRWRVGNTTDYSVDLSAYKKLDSEIVLARLKELAAAL